MASRSGLRTEHITEDTGIECGEREVAPDRLPGGTGGQPVELLYGYDAEIAEWVRLRLGMDTGFGESAAIGIVRDNQIIAGIVYYCYRHPNIEMSIATTTPAWANKSTLRGIFEYPFTVLNCKRVTVLIDVENDKSLSLCDRLGYVREGLLREANPNGDAVLMGMLKSECRWI